MDLSHDLCNRTALAEVKRKTLKPSAGQKKMHAALFLPRPLAYSSKTDPDSRQPRLDNISPLKAKSKSPERREK